jgi:hypothetical protein
MKREEIPLCNHVKNNGAVCESPALKDQDHCYFHTAARERRKRQRRAARLKLPFQLPLLEDANSIQLAIGESLNALLAGQIDHKTAGLVLYGLQTAAGNIRHTDLALTEYDRQAEDYEEEEEESIEEEPSAKPVTTAINLQPAKPRQKQLPPKKSVDKEILDVACKLAMERAHAIKEQFKK